MSLTLKDFINPELPPVEQLNDRFTSAKPFGYIAIDNFLTPGAAEGLLKDFPSFDASRAINELGVLGGKATRDDLGVISAFYASVDRLISSPEFLDYISRISGIPNLIYDPTYYGGGTHESRDGQELDVHIDFNYDAATGLYRRLNLLIYLNKEWDASWGGNIELHSNPREPDEDTMVAFEPLFNRAVMFETHEHSWHGFDKIKLPPEKKHLSRKSLSVYFYSRERPTEEEVPPHTTFYVQRPLPKHILPGYTLTEEDHLELKGLLAKRDNWIHFYQRKEMEFNKTKLDWERALGAIQSSVRLPTHGYITQTDQPKGFWADNWVGAEMSFTIQADVALKELAIRCYLPEYFESSLITVAVNGREVSRSTVFPAQLSDLRFPLVLPAGQSANVAIRSAKTFNPEARGRAADNRDLAFLLQRIIGYH